MKALPKEVGPKKYAKEAVLKEATPKKKANKTAQKEARQQQELERPMMEVEAMLEAMDAVSQ